MFDWVVDRTTVGAAIPTVVSRLEYSLQHISGRWQCLEERGSCANLLKGDRWATQLGGRGEAEGREGDVLATVFFSPWCTLSVPRPPGQGAESSSGQQRLLVVLGKLLALSSPQSVGKREKPKPGVMSVPPNLAGTRHASKLSRTFARCLHTHNPISLSPQP